MMIRRVFATLFFVGMTTLSGNASVLAQGVYPTPQSTIGLGAGVAGQLPSSSNPVLWKQYQALQSGTPISGCQSCGGKGGSGLYNRCGCNTELFPWITGPGSCDQWCVGPKWDVEANGLILFRGDADWNRVIGLVGGSTSHVDQFDAGVGGRVFVTGYNESGFGMQVGWEGVDSWDATLAFDPVGTETRTFRYESRLNSLEVNFLPQVPYTWKLFTGFRFVELAEGFSDARVNDKPIPLPVAVPAAPVAVVDTTVSRLLKNQLIGFQIGGRRDAWNWGKRLTIETFLNAGVYYNRFRRDDVVQTDTTIITGDDIDTPDDEFSMSTSTVRTSVRTKPSDIAFLGEAGISSIWKINQCVALRSGYQVMAIDGVGGGLDAYFASGLNSNSLLYHGLQFGIEYRR